MIHQSDFTNELDPKAKFRYFVLEDLQLIRNAGFGGGGQVSKAKIKSFGIVAVKTFNAADYYSEKKLLVEFREMFTTIRFVHHPNIISFYGPLYDDHSTQVTKGYVMEYMECGDLKTVIEQAYSLNYNKFHVISWWLQAARALTFIHQNDVMHRDIKSQNLVLSKDYKLLKICDFGWARKMALSLSTLPGTIVYQAPEIQYGLPYDTKCDVFSLCLTVWELLHRTEIINVLPTERILMYNGYRPPITTDMLDVNNVVDQEILRLMTRGWEEDPNKRISAFEMMTILEELSDILQLDSMDLSLPFKAI